MTIETDNAVLHVAEHGAGQRTLVFLHYWGGSGRTWMDVAAALGERNLCLMPDLPGWGQSGPSRSGYRIADLAEAVGGMIEARQLRDVVLVGHSMGGKIAQYLAGQRPAWLKELVLVASSPALPMDVPEPQRLAMQSAYDSRASVEETLDHVLTETSLVGPTRERAILDSLAGDPTAKAAWPAVAMLEDISETTRCIDVPTLLLIGECDRVDPPAVLADRLVPFLPTPETHELAGIGHLLPLEAPVEVAGHIQRWLNEHRG
ncbi:alpha/beta fold hydrolase [Chromohalobacter moromii]|uniref:Alpha/beta hydrolase n=1 Tax=Chromohalobacter moromii TaxID=2860329 RepID=A0A9X3B2W1_9GAMM|nr:alpha/beta hydrolase [Chromohalobacter moromii]MCK2044697.1 alpha/beta hydrolase [Chromohalobacter moromii]MCT8504149.1 alpha/beta hydrolase [Chromohalobacter moromii]